MQQKLIIYLQNDSVQSVLLSESCTQQINTEDLSQYSENSEVIVLLPSEQVSLTSIKLPKMNRSRLHEAIPYALEEQIIADVETMHFVPDKNPADDTYSVAIIPKEKIATIINQLKSWNVQPDIVMSSLFALPVEENTWTIFLNDMAEVRTNAFYGFTCDILNLNEMLDIALSSSIALPENIHIHNYTQKPYAPLLNVNATVKEEFHDAKQFISDLGNHTLNFPYINLLHGVYKARKTKFPEMKKLWKVAGGLGVAWIALLLVYPFISMMILNHRMNGINTNIEQIYKRYFPNATSVVAPRVRMQEKLQTYNSYASEGKWLMLIGYLGKGMGESHGINLIRLDLQNNKLMLELTAASPEEFSTLTEYLNQQGLKVKQESANLSGSRVNATITVE